MNIQMIPLTQLVPSPANVRKTGARTGIAELAASIAAHGLLQNLQVRSGKEGCFEVVAGARRLAALKLLAKRKALSPDTAIGCNVLDAEADQEISLAENELRLAMHPADQFDAFKALIDSGKGVEDVAARFGVTPLVVRQRLKLAGVSPALRAEGIEDCPAMKQLAARHAAWATKLPDQEDALWDWLRTQEAATVTALLAYCVALTVEPVRNPQTDRLATALSLDMAQWWQPTAAGYFGRVSKTLILDAVTEGAGPNAAHGMATLKKKAMAKSAEQLLATTGWLPGLLRAA